jgi:hypothetical protein
VGGCGGGSDEAGEGETRLGAGSVCALPGPLSPLLGPDHPVGQVEAAVLLGVVQFRTTMSTGKIFLK